MSDYQLFNGDCLQAMEGMAAQSVDAVICDPPYGTTACKWDSVIPFASMWTGIKHVLKPRGAVVLFGSQPFTSALVMSNVKWFKYCWVWDKGKGVGHLVAKFRPMQQSEDICIFGEESVNYYPIMTKTKHKRWSKEGSRTEIMGGRQSENYEGQWLEYSHPKTIIQFLHSEKLGHPTQKPVALLEYLIRTYTNEGDTVLDFTMGSGTTGVAAMLTGRKFIGIELDSEYVAIAEARIAKAAQVAAGEFVDKIGTVKDAVGLPLFAIEGD